MIEIRKYFNGNLIKSICFNVENVVVTATENLIVIYHSNGREIKIRTENVYLSHGIQREIFSTWGGNKHLSLHITSKDVVQNYA